MNKMEKQKNILVLKQNGKAKEYFGFDNRIAFIGEYLNGKRNGKGKECNSWGDLMFEGEFKNGQRNGKGKEYNGKHLIYEGEYLNGQRNGKGKEYHISNGKILFEGEYLKYNMWIKK